MAKRQLRICDTCGAQEETFSKVSTCEACFLKIKTASKIQAEKMHLISLGYKVIGEPILSKSNHRQYTLIPPCCEIEFAPTYGNVLKQLALLGKPPCANCGGKARMNKAMAAYVQMHTADYDLEKFEDYRLKVRRLSGREYECWRHVINPMDYPRGHGIGMWHLDHKVPIIWCFKNDIPAEVASAAQNLQMLSSVDNLKKSGKLLSDADARIILRESSISHLVFSEVGEVARDKIDIVSDTANVWETVNKLTIRESEYREHPNAVLARINYYLGNIRTTIGARKLELKYVFDLEAEEFINLWHVQGYTSAKYTIGLWLGNILISLMSFGPPRYKQASADWELIRFCSHGEYSTPGAASKLFKHFLKDKLPKMVVSYSLNRWGRGELYNTLGFDYRGTSQSPRYLWRSDGKLRTWRASILMAKRKGIPQSKGEIEGTLKIHDPGSSTWMYTAADAS
jgi:hypothetical protein